ncbi:hypothetical protein L3Q82_001122 [Scortum barcoo]|uniref:Uncharacterized protein n=1 Tax=Scortum barcoo TaxID=214431 RepID=A0ACB8WAU6_9TELE|nr:hypothetical protein L3Q82_001122 [Scortum barcoo]
MVKRGLDGPLGSPCSQSETRAPPTIDGKSADWSASASITARDSQSEDALVLPKVTGQTKSGSEAHHEKKNIKDRYVARIGVTGAPPWSQAWGWGSRRRAPGGRVFAHGTRPGSARNGDVGPPSSRLTTRRKVHEGPVQCGLGSSRGREPRRPNPWNKTLAIGTWNVTSLGGKEPELVREVERYRLGDSWAHLHA